MKILLDISMLLIPFIDFIWDIRTGIYPDIRFVYFIYLAYFLTYIKFFITASFFRVFITEFRLFALTVLGIFLLSLYNIYAGNTTLFLFLKQFTVVSFISFTSFMFIYNNRNNLHYIIGLYLKISFIFACIAVFQEIFYIIGFKPFYDFSYLMINLQQIGSFGRLLRVSSFCAEPPMFAFALIPATFISLYCFMTGNFKFVSKTKSFIIIVATLLTYSVIGYFSLFLSTIILLLWNFKNVKIKLFILLLLLSIFLFSLGGNGITMRIKDLIELQQNDISQYKLKANFLNSDKKEANSSSYLITVHFKRSIDDFYENPILGKGLGSYTYTKNAIKLKKYVLAEFSSWDPFRLDGSTSLIFKIVVEFGLIGVIMLFVILYRYYIFDFKYINKFNYFVIINNAMLVYILFILIRMPFYFCNGLWIFVWLYIFSKQQFLQGNTNLNAFK